MWFPWGAQPWFLPLCSLLVPVVSGVPPPPSRRLSCVNKALWNLTFDLVCFLPPPLEPCYDPVHDDEDLNVAALRRLSLKRSGSIKGLKLKPAAWVSASRQGSSWAPGHSDVSLIDFGEENPPATPSPVVDLQIPSIAKLALEAENLLDRTPPQSPCRSLPRPLHPTPVVDWDSRPLPPPPAYDDVAQDEDDMEV